MSLDQDKRPKFPTAEPPRDIEHYLRNAMATMGRVAEDAMSLSTVNYLESLQWEQIEASFDNATRICERLLTQMVNLNTQIAEARVLNDQHTLSLKEGEAKLLEDSANEWRVRVEVLRIIAQLIEQDQTAKKQGNTPVTSKDWLAKWNAGNFDANVDLSE